MKMFYQKICVTWSLIELLIMIKTQGVKRFEFSFTLLHLHSLNPIMCEQNFFLRFTLVFVERGVGWDASIHCKKNEVAEWSCVGWCFRWKFPFDQGKKWRLINWKFKYQTFECLIWQDVNEINFKLATAALCDAFIVSNMQYDVLTDLANEWLDYINNVSMTIKFRVFKQHFEKL